MLINVSKLERCTMQVVLERYTMQVVLEHCTMKVATHHFLHEWQLYEPSSIRHYSLLACSMLAHLEDDMLKETPEEGLHGHP
jgi:hypothetical protein